MIHFSKTEDYSVLLLNYLTAEYKKRLVPLSEIATEYHIPILFLRNIAAKLRQAGFIDAVEGKNGGYRLSKNPKSITLGEVLRIFSDKPLLAECADGNHPCTCGMGATLCNTGSQWRRMNQEFLEKVSDISLGDFINKSK